MSTKNVRQVVSSVVENNGQTVSHEGVPLREQIFPATALATPSGVSSALQLVQREVGQATQAARTLPYLGGVYFPNVIFEMGVPQAIPHRVPGPSEVAWTVHSRRPGIGPSNGLVQLGTIAEIEQGNGTITLEANENVVCDLFFFSRPGNFGPKAMPAFGGYLPYGQAGAGQYSSGRFQFYDVRDFGSVGDGITSDSAAIAAGIAALNSTGFGTLQSAHNTLIFPTPNLAPQESYMQSYLVTQPIFVTVSGSRLEMPWQPEEWDLFDFSPPVCFTNMAKENNSTDFPPRYPTFIGPIVVITQANYPSPTYTLDGSVTMASLTSGAFGGPYLHFGMNKTGHLNGLNEFTFEGYFKISGNFTANAIFAASNGAHTWTELGAGNPYTASPGAFILYNDFSNSNKLTFALRTTNGLVVVTSASGNPYPVGSKFFLEASWDGTTMHLFVNGTSVGSASQSGTIVQQYYEDFTVGCMYRNFAICGPLVANNPTLTECGSLRCSTKCRHTSNYFAPTTELTGDQYTAFLYSFAAANQAQCGFVIGQAWVDPTSVTPGGGSGTARYGSTYSSIFAMTATYLPLWNQWQNINSTLMGFVDLVNIGVEAYGGPAILLSSVENCRVKNPQIRTLQGQGITAVGNDFNLVVEDARITCLNTYTVTGGAGYDFVRGWNWCVGTTGSVGAGNNVIFSGSAKFIGDAAYAVVHASGYGFYLEKLYLAMSNYEIFFVNYSVFADNFTVAYGENDNEGNYVFGCGIRIFGNTSGEGSVVFRDWDMGSSSSVSGPVPSVVIDKGGYIELDCNLAAGTSSPGIIQFLNSPLYPPIVRRFYTIPANTPIVDPSFPGAVQSDAITLAGDGLLVTAATGTTALSATQQAYSSIKIVASGGGGLTLTGNVIIDFGNIGGPAGTSAEFKYLDVSAVTLNSHNFYIKNGSLTVDITVFVTANQLILLKLQSNSVVAK